MIFPEFFAHENLGENILVKNFTALDPKECAEILRIRNHKNVRKNSYVQEKISSENHEIFINELKKSKEKCYFAVFREREILGVCGLNEIDFLRRSATGAIYKNQDLQEKLGEKILGILEMLAFCEIKLQFMRLEVLAHNYRAILLYESAGFTLVSSTFLRQENKILDLKIYEKTASSR